MLPRNCRGYPFFCRMFCCSYCSGQLVHEYNGARLVFPGISVGGWIVPYLSHFLFKPSGNKLALAHRSLQSPARHILEVAGEMGLVVCGGSGSLGVRDDPLSAPSHRSGVSGARSSFCLDVCANRLSVAGVAARHRASWFRFR